MKSRKIIIGTVIGIGILIIITGGCIKPSEWPTQLSHKLDLPSTIEPDHAEIEELNECIEEGWTELSKYHPGEEAIKGELSYIEYEIKECIDYCTDLENPDYQAFEHFPTVTQVFESRVDDCDGRAIVACSLLIHRGYNSYVIMNDRHAWVITYLDDGSTIEILKNPIPEDDHSWLLQWNDQIVKINFAHPIPLLIGLIAISGITSTQVISKKKGKTSIS